MGVVGLGLAAAALLAGGRGAAAAEASTRHLAFQVFTGGFDSAQMRQAFPPARGVAETVDDVIAVVGLTGSRSRKLAFVPGPLAFDNTDAEIRRLIRESFDIALRRDVAAGFHLDDSMFWGRLSHLNAARNLEWLDWEGTPNTGRRLDWSSTPMKIMPQLCLNSPAVRAEVAKRARLIGEEVGKGRKRLAAAGKGHLFLGVIMGWETQIGRDFDTGAYLGYCALANKGFGRKNPPQDIDRERETIVLEFIDFWSQSLARAGVPEDRIYSHIAFMSRTMFDVSRRADPGRFDSSYSRAVNFTPPRVAFGAAHRPGFSTYPQPGHLEELGEELKKRGDPPWASSEGTAIDPSEAERGGKGSGMEGYLGNLFNHGAQVVNIFGWGVGDGNNPFRRVAEGDDAIAAYRKFLRGDRLAEAPMAVPQIPSAALQGKARRMQAKLPDYIRANGPSRVATLVERFQGHLQRQEFREAERAVDEILNVIE